MASEKVLTFVAVTYHQMDRFILPSFVYNILGQTWDNWKLIILHDGPSSDGSKEFMEQIVAQYPDQVTYIESETRENCWGHQNRALGLSLVDTPWVTFTNVDNQYCWDFVHHLWGDMTNGRHDVICFRIAHNYFGYKSFYNWFDMSQCDMMQFAVRTEMAKTAGFNHRVHEADGLFIRDLNRCFPNLRLVVHEGTYGIHN
jgi:glycosyltransferase involved in cell wall biosynthesis